MSRFQKIRNIIIALLMIIFAAALIIDPEDGILLVAAALGIILLVYGIQKIIYYFSMAMHMVGGKLMLYIGIVVLDAGLFILTLSDVPRIYIVLYLVGINAFSGVIGILRAFELKGAGAGWKFKFASSLFQILIGAASLVFIKNTQIVVYIFAAGLLYSAIERIVSSFRKTKIIYIQ